MRKRSFGVEIGEVEIEHYQWMEDGLYNLKLVGAEMDFGDEVDDVGSYQSISYSKENVDLPTLRSALDILRNSGILPEGTVEDFGEALNWIEKIAAALS